MPKATVTKSRAASAPSPVAARRQTAMQGRATDATRRRSQAPVVVEPDEIEEEEDVVTPARGRGRPRSAPAPVVEPEEEEEDEEEDEEDEDEEEDEEEEDEEEEDEDEEDEDEEEDEEDEEEEDEEEEDEEEEDEEELPPPPPVKKPTAKAAPAAKAAAPKSGTAAITARKSTALAVAPRSRARELTVEDMILPKLKVGQGTSKAVMNRQVEFGSWYITGRNKDLGQTVYIIAVDVSKSRSIFERGVGVICRSYDMVQGVGDPGVLCEGTEEEMASVPRNDRGCEFRLFQDTEDGKRIRPRCQEAYNYPVIVLLPPDDAPEDEPLDLETCTPVRAVMTLRSTHLPAGRAINTAVMTGIPVSWHMNVFELTNQLTSTPNGTWYVPSVEHLGETPEALVPAAVAYADTITDSFFRANLQATEADED